MNTNFIYVERIMTMPINLKNEKHKMWLIRFMAFIITALCVVTLRWLIEPPTFYRSILVGTFYSLFLNAPLWFASLRFMRTTKLKFPLAIFLFLSALIVFTVIHFSMVLAVASILFYFWVIYDLFARRKQI